MTAVGRSPVAQPRIDPRMAQRVVEVRRAEGRRRLRVLVGAAALVATAGLAVAVAESPLGAVRHVRVIGAAGDTAAAVAAAARIGPATPMVHLGATAAAARVEGVPVVATARVVRQWPATVRIEVTLRRPVAVLAAGAGTVTVDASGRVLGPASAADAGLPRLSFPTVPTAGSWVPGSPGVAGRRPAPAVAGQLALAVALPGAGLPLAIPVVASEQADGLELAVGTTTVVLGDGGDLTAQVTALAAIEAATPLGAGGTLDLRVPDRPTFVAPLTTKGSTGSVSTGARG